MLCVGETQKEYKAGIMEQVIDEQICGCLTGVDAQKHILKNDQIVIVYEPYWAIIRGTGLVAQAAALEEQLSKNQYNACSEDWVIMCRIL